MRKKGTARLLGFALLIGLLAVIALVARNQTPSEAPEHAPAAAPAESRATREIVLYFGSPDGAYLVPETREIEDCPVEADCLPRVVQALAAGPESELVPLLPKQTRLLKAAFENGTATLDLSRDLIEGHPGGSLSELLTVYALADTLAVNFPHIRQTRILIEGQAVETLKGHLGLQEPIKADFRYTRPPEGVGGGAPAEPATGERRSL